VGALIRKNVVASWDMSELTGVVFEQTLNWGYVGLVGSGLPVLNVGRQVSLSTKPLALNNFPNVLVVQGTKFPLMFRMDQGDLADRVARIRALVSAGRNSQPYSSPATGIDPMDQLRKLGELRDVGVVSTGEFEAKKAELLGSPGHSSKNGSTGPDTDREADTNTTDAQTRDSQIAGTKECPDCAERVKQAARICRFCRHEFWAEGETAPTTRPADPTGLIDDVAGQSDAVPEAVKIVVWQRDKGKCVLCGDHRNLVIGRVVPASRGGASTPANLKLLCEACSRRMNGPAA
jgi:hypothetical protein